MIKIAKMLDEEKKLIFESVAYQMRINPAIIEKDYWVCLTLYYLFSFSSFKDHLVFKGGTCLSKVYNVIERFSEDIDLILDWRLLNYGILEPWNDRSKTKQLKFIEETRIRLFQFLKNVFLPKFKEEMSKLLGFNINAYIREDDLGTVLFEYPRLYDNNSILNEIRIEIGTLASWEPNKDATLVPYISKYYPNLFNNPIVNVKATTIERTFWEKITILHQESHRPETSKMPNRYSRHYYDVYKIYQSELIDKNSEKFIELLPKVAIFKDKFYPRAWARYDLARIGTLKIVPKNIFMEQLKKDYQDMQDMIYDERPNFNELIDSIKKIEEDINSLK